MRGWDRDVASDWVHHTVGALAWMMPGELKLFDVGEVDAAIAWAAG